MNLKSYKVATRLMLAFGVVFMAMLLSAVVAMINFSQVKSAADQIVTKNMAAIEHSSVMKESVQMVLQVVPRLILLRDPQAIAQERQRLLESRQRYDAAAQRLAEITTTDEGRARLEAIERDLQAARQANNRVIELVLAGQNEPAVGLLFEQAQPAALALMARLSDNINQQREQASVAKLYIEQTYQTGRLQTAGAASLVALLSIFFGLYVARSITRQLGGEPQDAAELADRVARGDLTMPVPLQPGDFGSMLAQLKTMQHSLVEVVSSVRTSAHSVAGASAQIASASSGLSIRTEEQASALEQTSALMEQMRVNVGQTAESARQANLLAQGACEVAQRGGEVVGQVVQTMRGINESSQRIADIIGVIDGIAFQTNILALNAAVEAARAGEQGRGFAVVASEVRSLAGRSAEAAKEIKTLIGASVERVGQGTLLVDQAGATMGEVVQAIERATLLMREISAAVQESDAGVQQVTHAVLEIDRVTQHNAALVEESAAAAAMLELQAKELVQTVAVFQVADSKEQAEVLTLTEVVPTRSRASTGKPPAQLREQRKALRPLVPGGSAGLRPAAAAA